MSKQSVSLVLAVVVLAASAPVSAISSNGLVAYYTFNGNADDGSGNGHNGTVYGAVLATDRFGVSAAAYGFDGTDDYIAVPYADTLQTSQFTLGAWVQPRGDVSTGFVIAARGEDFSTDLLWSSLQILGPDNPWGAGIHLIYEDNGDTEHIYDTGIIPRSDTWTHIAATRSLAGEVAIYVNGYAVGRWENTPSPATTCTQELTIGARWWSLSTSGPHRLTGFFSGSIDDVMVYSRPLTGEEIMELAVVPAPGAILLGSIGALLVGWVRRKRML